MAKGLWNSSDWTKLRNYWIY